MSRLTMREVEVPAFRAVVAFGDLQWLGAFAQRLARDTDEAQDLVQETLITAWTSPPAEATGLRPWLATVLRNRLRMRRRGSARRDARQTAVAQTVTDPAVPPDAAVARLRVLSHVTAELEQLPAADQQLIVRRFLEGQSAAEIARALSLPAGTVRSRIHRLLVRLRERLDKRCDGRDAWCAAIAALPVATGPAAPPTQHGTTTMIKTTLLLLLAGTSATAAYAGLRDHNEGPTTVTDFGPLALAPASSDAAEVAHAPATTAAPNTPAARAGRERWEATKAALTRSMKDNPPTSPAPAQTDTKAAYVKLVLACVRDLEEKPSKFSVKITEIGAPDIGVIVSEAEVVDSDAVNAETIECAEQSMYAYQGPAPTIAFERTFRLGMRLPGARKRSPEQQEIRLHFYMDANFKDVRACEPPGLSKGHLDLDVTADATGKVTAVVVAESTVDGSTSDCIKDVAASWTFPEPVTTQTTRHRYFLPVQDLKISE